MTGEEKEIMEHPDRDDEIVYRFLLDELEPARRVRIEESLFLEPAFLELVEATEQGLLQSYLRNELSGARLAAVERIYLPAGPRRQRLEQERAFRDAVLSMPEARPAPGKSRWDWPSGIWSWEWKVAGCFAAIALLAITLNRAERQTGSPAKPVAPLAMLRLRPGVLRSESGVSGYAILKAPSGAGFVRLHLSLRKPAEGAMEAVLGTPERPGVWAGPVVKDGPLTAYADVDAGTLTRGDYILAVKASTELMDSYVFRVD